jgi:diaminopimelate epimerase
MEYEIISADPAGNITVFVLNPPADAAERAKAVQALLADRSLKAEQVGFVIKPRSGGLWRLEMMGGEFCGNAARSFGLLAARQSGICGRHTLMIETSGMAQPLSVHIDTEAQTAEADIAPPLAETLVEWKGRRFPAYIFEGISHIIAENVQPDEALARSLIGGLDKCRIGGSRQADAAGVMFYDSEKRFMRPVVWVRAAGTFLFESSCGSGSAALAVWAARNVADTETSLAIAQPGGVIETSVTKQAGKITRLSIGGRVTLGEIMRRMIPQGTAN